MNMAHGWGMPVTRNHITKEIPKCLNSTILLTKKNKYAMTSLEMVQYKRTDDMNSLHLMLANESSIYELWHDTATRLARRVLAGKEMDYDELAEEYGKKIAPSLERLSIRHHKICGEWLKVTDEQKRILAWQWFYNDIMETVLFLRQELK
nr:MAG TPA: hypothetical protein [Caudoviricetes sp.]